MAENKEKIFNVTLRSTSSAINDTLQRNHFWMFQSVRMGCQQVRRVVTVFHPPMPCRQHYAPSYETSFFLLYNIFRFITIFLHYIRF
jgi:hypothetical protein